jgi:hypothetical protein
VLGVGGAATVAEKKHLIAPSKSLGHLLCNLNDGVGLFSQSSAK